MAELSARDGKLVQYLNEAYGKEKELETALTAHIGMTTRAPYRKRLQQHLTETKRHARELERRIKRLGGSAQIVPIEGFDPVAKGAGAAVELGTRAIAAAKGPLHALRGTGEQEKMLKNAKTEYANEHEEIATYTAIETLAELLSDSETARLARAIRKEEAAMARFLERVITSLTKAVVQAEVPAAQRRTTRTSRKASTRKTSTRKASTRKVKRRSGASASGKAGTRAKASSVKRTAAKSSRGGSRTASKATRAGSRSGATRTSARGGASGTRASSRASSNGRAKATRARAAL